jgi:hypothetical protein
MAKKNAGKVAGLAALAGLAYMASQKGDKSDKSYDTLESKRLSRKVEPEEAAVDTGDFLSRRLNRIDTDDGKAYSTNNLSPMSSPASVARSPKAPSASTSAPSGAIPDGAYRGIRSDMKPVSTGGSGGGRGPAIGEEAAYRAKPKPAIGSGGGRGPAIGEEAAYKAKSNDGGKSMIDRQNAAVARAEKSMVPNTGRKMTVDEYYDSGKAAIDKEQGMFKRGGKVKKMASGGMTSSASKRGDGIAQRGKTRGKMY